MVPSLSRFGTSARKGTWKDGTVLFKKLGPWMSPAALFHHPPAGVQKAAVMHDVDRVRAHGNTVRVRHAALKLVLNKNVVRLQAEALAHVQRARKVHSYHLLLVEEGFRVLCL